MSAHAEVCHNTLVDFTGEEAFEAADDLAGAVKLTSSGQSAGELISDQAAVTAAHTVKARARNSR